MINDIIDTNFVTNDGAIYWHILKMTLISDYHRDVVINGHPIFMMITHYDGKDDDDKDDDDDAFISYTHIDPKGRKLRFATPLGKVNILKMIKAQRTENDQKSTYWKLSKVNPVKIIKSQHNIEQHLGKSHGSRYL